MLHPGRCARLVSVVWHCRLCKHGSPDYSHLWFHVGGMSCPALPEQGRPSLPFKKLLKTQLFREHSPSYLALRLVRNLQLQQFHFCTLSFFLFHFVIFLM